ncbi:MAG: BlaI/MecI/CopY family transcriptional regulator [Oscillospiraceae bacterium]|nr:BlaI/MecI/CopY family transcriptional regulator [Oscillospiraceae bacterium]
MNKIKRLPDTEFEVMMCVWEHEPPCSTADIHKALEKTRSWNMSALQTMLNRLTEKGFLSTEKIGKNRCYTPLISKEEYLAAENRSFIERINGGSITRLVASLYDSRSIGEKDLAELMDYINKHTQNPKE